MRQTDLDILLREGEGSMLEYKESFSPSLARDLAAFANSSGGRILLGVLDNGKAVGVRDSNQLRAQIQDIARNCDPPVKILIGTVGEKAGTGIRRMIEDARKHKCPEPKFTVNGFFTATFWPNVEIARKITEQVGEQVGTKLALSGHQVEILHNCLQEKSLIDIMSQVGRKDRTKFRTKFIKPLVESGLLEMTIPDKPQSSKQCYRTTDLGRKILEQWSGRK